MKGRFPSMMLVKYPHLSAEDTRLWDKFIAEHHADFSSFDYDVKVGTGVIADAKVPQNIINDYTDLTKKRIDCLGYTENGVTIFEVKPRAGTTALGQLLSYSKLYQEDNPKIAVQALAIVTAMLNPDEQKIYKGYGIKVFIYPTITEQ